MPKEYRGRPIVRLDKDTSVELQTYTSATNGARWLFEQGITKSEDPSKILAVCRGKQTTSGGFKWKYAEEEDLPDEVWLEIKPSLVGRQNGYYVSNKGRIKDTYSLKNEYYAEGYFHISIKQKFYKVHRIVAMMFIPNPDNKPEVNHKDKNITNNDISDLEWVTRKENIEHACASPVHQYTLTKEFIKTHISISEAGRELDCCFQNIQKVCTGERKKAGGFVWEYA